MSGGRSNMKLAENTSTMVVRIEAPSFKAKHGPLGLFFLWLSVLVVSFSVGATGPLVLSNHGAGQVVNTTTMVNYTEVENGTIVTFNLHPGSYPGSEEYRVVSSNDDVHYTQTWSIRGVEHHGAHAGLDHQGLDLATAHVHRSETTCKGNGNGKGKGGSKKDGEWCDGHFIFGKDHVRPVGYFFKLFLHRLPPDVVAPAFYDQNTAQFDIRVVTMNPKYTSFELGFKLFFFSATLLLSFWPHKGFVYQCFSVADRKKDLTSNHYWIAGMLGGLLLFNEPLMAVRVGFESSADVLNKAQMAVSTMFVGYLLYYWLVVLDDCRLRAVRSQIQRQSRDGMSAMEVGGSGSELVANPFNFYTKTKEETLAFVVFYLPKMGLVGAIWASLFLIYVTFAVQTERDPSFQAYSDGGGGLVHGALKALFVVSIVLMSAYLAWVLVLVVWAATLLPHIAHAHRWLGALTVFTLSLVCAGVFVGVAYPVPSSSVVFLGFYGMINVYVWIMAIAWTPLPTESLESVVQMTSTAGAKKKGQISQETGDEIGDFGEYDGGMEDIDMSTKQIV